MDSLFRDIDIAREETEDAASCEFNMVEALRQSRSSPEELREKPAIFDKYRDAMYSLSGPVPMNGFDDEFSVKQSYSLHAYEGNRDTKRGFRKTKIIPSSSTDFDISIITQTSIERLFYFPHLLARWDGPISAAVFLQDERDEAVFAHFIRNTPLPRRFRIVTYTQTAPHNCVVYYQPISLISDIDASSVIYGKEDGLPYRRTCVDNAERIYPINRLRNIAIQNTLTTHFLVLDMDMWPVASAYHDLVTLPYSMLRNEHLALILPAFSLKKKVIRDCSSFQDCVEKVIPLIPRNKTQLAACVEAEECSTFRPESFTHNYMVDGWYTLPASTRFLFKQCFNHVFQEPYLMVRRSAFLPLFDDRFINYGYNKVQWVETLRWLGFQFALVTQSFAVDVPHPPSEYARSWTKQWEKKDNANITMRRVYRKYLTELRNLTNDDSTVFVCYRYKNRFTKNIAVNYQDMKDKREGVKEMDVREEKEMSVREEKVTDKRESGKSEKDKGDEVEKRTSVKETSTRKQSLAQTKSITVRKEKKGRKVIVFSKIKRK
ncbi:hypothetical protein WA556_006418 [Blastocystis sp. ATCC 50177/Nand II]